MGLQSAHTFVLCVVLKICGNVEKFYGKLLQELHSTVNSRLSKHDLTFTKIVSTKVEGEK